MKLTQILYRQHIGWHLKQIWKVQSRRQVVLTKAEKLLREKGVDIIDPNEFVRTKKKTPEK